MIRDPAAGQGFAGTPDWRVWLLTSGCIGSNYLAALDIDKYGRAEGDWYTTVTRPRPDCPSAAWPIGPRSPSTARTFKWRQVGENSSEPFNARSSRSRPLQPHVPCESRRAGSRRRNAGHPLAGKRHLQARPRDYSPAPASMPADLAISPIISLR
jgi:hypothetical protein